MEGGCAGSRLSVTCLSVVCRGLAGARRLVRRWPPRAGVLSFLCVLLQLSLLSLLLLGSWGALPSLLLSVSGTNGSTQLFMLLLLLLSSVIALATRVPRLRLLCTLLWFRGSHLDPAPPTPPAPAPGFAPTTCSLGRGARCVPSTSRLVMRLRFLGGADVHGLLLLLRVMWLALAICHVHILLSIAALLLTLLLPLLRLWLWLTGSIRFSLLLSLLAPAAALTGRCGPLGGTRGAFAGIRRIACCGDCGISVRLSLLGGLACRLRLPAPCWASRRALFPLLLLLFCCSLCGCASRLAGLFLWLWRGFAALPLGALL